MKRLGFTISSSLVVLVLSGAALAQTTEPPIVGGTGASFVSRGQELGVVAVPWRTLRVDQLFLVHQRLGESRWLFSLTRRDVHARVRATRSRR
jgi:hypothetical protein